MRRWLAVLLLLFPAARVNAENPSLLRLATTTTTENSGLIAHLVPVFEAAHAFDVRVLAVGSGRALRLLANGDVDVALTHAPRLERTLLERGDTGPRHPVMYNDFVLVGPPHLVTEMDDAGGLQSALAFIHDKAKLFLSRGDESGTHQRETTLWQQVGMKPAAAWYRQTGQGMGRTLLMASELEAFTLTDRGTWLAYRDRLELALAYEHSEMLRNEYSLLLANAEKHPRTNLGGAMAFRQWLLSKETAALIRAFRIDGQALFVPLL